MKTTAGVDWIAAQLGAARYVGISADATAPAAADTVLASEETTNGLGRATAAYAHTTGGSTYTLTSTWTYTGSTTKTIHKRGVFSASSGGTLVYESVLSPADATVSASGDSLTDTDTITIS